MDETSRTIRTITRHGAEAVVQGAFAAAAGGGLPLHEDGGLIGGVRISGGSPADDVAIAGAAVAAIREF